MTYLPHPYSSSPTSTPWGIVATSVVTCGVVDRVEEIDSGVLVEMYKTRLLVVDSVHSIGGSVRKKLVNSHIDTSVIFPDKRRPTNEHPKRRNSTLS